MDVRLIDRPDVRVAYLRLTGPYGPAIGRFWQREVAPWMVTDGLMGRPRYGISLDDPSVTDPAQCRYDACVEVDAGYVPSGRAQVTTLPGGRYAATAVRGTGEQVGQAWGRLLGQWLPSSRLQLDSRPCFEYYPADAAYDEASGAFECELCIPVAPL